LKADHAVGDPSALVPGEAGRLTIAVGWKCGSLSVMQTAGTVNPKKAAVALGVEIVVVLVVWPFRQA
jgi:hypothetical protein